MSLQKIIVAATAGLVAGAVIGVLTAPASGKETRQNIADSAEDLKKKLQKLRGQAVDELDELKQVFETEVEGLQDDVKERVLALINKAKVSKNNFIAEITAN
ncbi:YtxH domain-containing protein [Parasediminibacterium paludis]|jgi:gas vesicle protein|uniref:YtxH domain-containing protein n=1 Tax=Parasediminibacterium paludis TaxID=908966 RepID=A0ABV8Q071_9BACT